MEHIDENNKLEILDEKKFTLTPNDEKYILYCSKTNCDSILFKLMIDSDLSADYYELNYESKKLLDLSKLFEIYLNLNELYNVLIDNLSKNIKDIKFELFKDNNDNNKEKVKLFFKLSLPDGQNEEKFIILIKKQFDIKLILSKINTKIDSIIDYQNKFNNNIEEKISEINDITVRQNNAENEYNKILEIDNIKKKFLELENNDNTIYKNKIEKYEKECKDILIEIEEIIKNDKLKIEQKLKIQEISESLKEKINFINNQQNIIQNLLNEKDILYDKVNEKIINCKKLLEKFNKDFDIIKKNDELIKKDIEEKKNEINNIKLNQINLENNKQIKKNENIKKIMNEIEKIQKENLEMKNKIEKNNNKLNLFIKSINENNINKKNDSYENINGSKKNPKNFKFEKTISNDLFRKYFNNNRACIFNSCIDNKIYIIYGIISLDLECYDILDDKKFILIKKLHKMQFDSCRYFYDENNKRDLIVTTSLDNHVKVINFKKEKSEIILDLNFEPKETENEKEKEKVLITTACISYENIMVPFSMTEIVSFYTLNKEHIADLTNVGYVFGIKNYYCKKDNKNYVLITNNLGIYVYYIDSLILYNKFIIPKEKDKEKKNNIIFYEAYIIEKNNELILVGHRFDLGNLYFWSFSNFNFIQEINLSSEITDIYPYDNNFIFASLYNSEVQFVLINVDNQKSQEIEKNFIVEDRDSRGSGIKILRNINRKDYLISYSLSGKLDLYLLEE